MGTAEWLRSGLGDTPSPTQPFVPPPGSDDVVPLIPEETVIAPTPCPPCACASTEKRALSKAMIVTAAAGIFAAVIMPKTYQCVPLGRCNAMMYGIALAPTAVLGAYAFFRRRPA